MRRLIPFFVAALAVPAFAQSNVLGVFFDNPGGGYSKQHGSYFNAGYGIDYRHQFSPRWSGAISVARESYAFSYFTAAGTSGTSSSPVYPIDATVQYRFFTSGRWHPYAGGGLRYVRNSGVFFPGYGSRLTPEVLGGLEFQMTRRLSIFGDVKQGLRTETGPRWDPLTKTSFGLRFAF
jgi:hypothetical protein